MSLSPSFGDTNLLHNKTERISEIRQKISRILKIEIFLKVVENGQGPLQKSEKYLLFLQQSENEIAFQNEKAIFSIPNFYAISFLLTIFQSSLKKDSHFSSKTRKKIGSIVSSFDKTTRKRGNQIKKNHIFFLCLGRFQEFLQKGRGKF